MEPHCSAKEWLMKEPVTQTVHDAVDVIIDASNTRRRKKLFLKPFHSTDMI
jgi:hypothetical protein